MPPLLPRATSARVVLPALCLALSACRDVPISVASSPVRPAPPLAAGDVRVALQLVDSAAGEARLALRLEHPGVRVGAYSGAVRFDAEGVEVVEAMAADAGGGGLVNARAGEPGMVRFAGFDVTAGRSDVLAVVRVRVRDWAALARTTTELTAVATDAGVTVPAERLRQARGVTIGLRGAR